MRREWGKGHTLTVFSNIICPKKIRRQFGLQGWGKARYSRWALEQHTGDIDKRDFSPAGKKGGKESRPRDEEHTDKKV